MRHLPNEFVGNVLIPSSGTPWAIWRFRGPNGMASFSWQSDAQLVAYANTIAGLIQNLPGRSRLWSVSQPVASKELDHRIRTAPDIATETRWNTESKNAAFESVIDWAVSGLDDQPAFRRDFFLATSIDGGETSVKDLVVDQVAGLFGRQNSPISEHYKNRLLESADHIGAALGELAPTAATPEEIAWLYERAAVRGLLEQPPYPCRVDPNDGNRRGRFQVPGSLTEGVDRGGVGLPRHRHILEVESPIGTSYQTSLVVTQLPQSWDFPNEGFWAADVEVLDFPVDVTFLIESPEQHETQKRYRRRHKELVSQPDHYGGVTTGVPDDVFGAIEQSNSAQTHLSQSRLNRIHRTTIVYTLGAESVAELQANLTVLRAVMKERGCELTAPTGDQRSLFLLGLPGTTLRPGGVETDYSHELTAEAVSSFLPGYRPALGDEVGLPVGRRADLGSRGNVLLSPSRTTSASTIGFGRSGGGKSFTAKVICYNELLQGGQVVVIDRSTRGEYVQFAGGLERLVHTEVVDLASASLTLCPLSTYRSDHPRAVEVTTSFLSLLAGVEVRSEENALLAEAVETVAQTESGTTADVLELLHRTGGPARNLYYRIKPLSATSFARLAFQPGPGLGIGGADLIVLHANGLVLPSREQIKQGNLSANDAASIPMVYLLMALAEFIGNTPDRLTSIVLDEAWAFLDSSFGLDLANRVLRDGRKDYKKLQLWSQRPGDVPAGLVAMASNVFVSRQIQGTGAEALELVGAEPSPEHVAEIENLTTGQLLLRDERGRLGLVDVELPNPSLFGAVDTTPSTSAIEDNDPQNLPSTVQPQLDPATRVPSSVFDLADFAGSQS